MRAGNSQGGPQAREGRLEPRQRSWMKWQRVTDIWVKSDPGRGSKKIQGWGTAGCGAGRAGQGGAPIRDQEEGEDPQMLCCQRQGGGQTGGGRQVETGSRLGHRVPGEGGAQAADAAAVATG